MPNIDHIYNALGDERLAYDDAGPYVEMWVGEEWMRSGRAFCRSIEYTVYCHGETQSVVLTEQDLLNATALTMKNAFVEGAPLAQASTPRKESP